MLGTSVGQRDTHCDIKCLGQLSSKLLYIGVSLLVRPKTADVYISHRKEDSERGRAIYVSHPAELQARSQRLLRVSGTTCREGYRPGAT